MKAIILLLLFFQWHGDQTSSIDIIQKHYNNDRIEVNVTEVVQSFKTALIEKAILNEGEFEHVNILHKRIYSIVEEFKPEALSIPSFIPKEPFIKAQSELENMREQRPEEVLFLYAQMLSEKHITFNLHLDERRLIYLKNNDLPINSFEAVLMGKINEQRYALPADSSVIITADARTPFEFVAFVMKKTRELGIRKTVLK